MRLFTQKAKLAHQLIGTMDEWKQLEYQCSVCTRTFHSAESASRNGEYCCGKRCYSEQNLPLPMTIGIYRETVPAYLMKEPEIKAHGRAIRKGQEPLAYFHFEIVARMDGKFTGYEALYDVRECLELENAVTLPDFA